MNTARDAIMVDEVLRGIAGFHLVTPDLPRLAAFYRDVLGFAVESPVHTIGATEMALLAIPGYATRQVFSIGVQRVAIEQFDLVGRPYPADGDAASLWFQHLALVVTDIGVAHARLRDITPISRRGPQQLPAASGGARAFKFRDPDGHPLELLEFRSCTQASWQGRTALPGQIALGIDHSAISVADLDASMRFYSRLGLSAARGTRNQGSAQQNLDDLPDVRVAVAPMRPQNGLPHLELLGYEAPRGNTGPTLRPNDVAATRIAWRGARVSLLADPDGHLQQVVS